MLRRLKVEKRKLEAAILEGDLIGIFPLATPLQISGKNNESLVWKFSLDGPHGSYYEGGVYEVEFKYPRDYPFKAPEITFLTKIWHSLFFGGRQACFQMVRYKWKPMFTTINILKQLMIFLKDPNINGCCSQNLEAKKQLKEDKEEFIKKAKEWTKLYATGSEEV